MMQKKKKMQECADDTKKRKDTPYSLDWKS